MTILQEEIHNRVKVGKENSILFHQSPGHCEDDAQSVSTDSPRSDIVSPRIQDMRLGTASEAGRVPERTVNSLSHKLHRKK